MHAWHSSMWMGGLVLQLSSCTITSPLPTACSSQPAGSHCLARPHCHLLLHCVCGANSKQTGKPTNIAGMYTGIPICCGTAQLGHSSCCLPAGEASCGSGCKQRHVLTESAHPGTSLMLGFDGAGWTSAPHRRQLEDLHRACLYRGTQ